MQPNHIVSRAEWIEARKALLTEEKALTRARDALLETRRALPWVRVGKDYVFDTVQGPMSLSDLFQGRSQLLIQHFMMTPGSDHRCPGCAFSADHVDAARQHFEHGDLAFAAVARAPLSEIEPFRKRMGWTFLWASSFGNDFNFDFGVSFTPEQTKSGEAIYNFRPLTGHHPDLSGTSVFAKDDSGQIFHTYSTYGRGDESLIGAFMFMDLVPKGRNEADGIMNWVRLHDEYDDAPSVAASRDAHAA